MGNDWKVAKWVKLAILCHSTPLRWQKLWNGKIVQMKSLVLPQMHCLHDATIIMTSLLLCTTYHCCNSGYNYVRIVSHMVGYCLYRKLLLRPHWTACPVQIRAHHYIDVKTDINNTVMTQNFNLDTPEDVTDKRESSNRNF